MHLWRLSHVTGFTVVTAVTAVTGDTAVEPEPWEKTQRCSIDSVCVTPRVVLESLDEAEAENRG
jgi:hypothetical protein